MPEGFVIEVSSEEFTEFAQSSEESFEKYIRENWLKTHPTKRINSKTNKPFEEIPSYQPIQIVVKSEDLNARKALLNGTNFQCTSGSSIQFEGDFDARQFPEITFPEKPKQTWKEWLAGGAKRAANFASRKVTGYEFFGGSSFFSGPSNYPALDPNDAAAIERHRNTIAKGIFWAVAVSANAGSFIGGAAAAAAGNVPVASGPLSSLLGVASDVVNRVSAQAMNAQLAATVLNGISTQVPVINEELYKKNGKAIKFLLEGPKRLVPQTLIDSMEGTAVGDLLLEIGTAMEHIERPLAAYRFVTWLSELLGTSLVIPRAAALAAIANNGTEVVSRIVSNKANPGLLAREVPGSKRFNKEINKVLFFAKFKKSLWIGAGTFAVVGLALFFGAAIPVVGPAVIAPISATAVTKAGAIAIAAGISLFSTSVSFFRINVWKQGKNFLRGSVSLGTSEKRLQIKAPAITKSKSEIAPQQQDKFISNLKDKIVKQLKEKIPVVKKVGQDCTAQRDAVVEFIATKCIEALQVSTMPMRELEKVIPSIIEESFKKKPEFWSGITKYLTDNYSESVEKIKSDLGRSKTIQRFVKHLIEKTKERIKPETHVAKVVNKEGANALSK